MVKIWERNIQKSMEIETNNIKVSVNVTSLERETVKWCCTTDLAIHCTFCLTRENMYFVYAMTSENARKKNHRDILGLKKSISHKIKVKENERNIK